MKQNVVCAILLRILRCLTPTSSLLSRRYNSGFIRAGDLKKVLENLGGVVMGSDEKTSIVKVEDEDLLINYETFSRALVGA